MSERASQQGLTLIEVLVAMLVLSVGIGTILTLISINTDNLASIEERMFARIAAENVMVLTVIDAELGVNEDGQTIVDLADYSFDVSVDRNAAPAPFETMETIQVTVAESRSEQVLARLETLRIP